MQPLLTATRWTIPERVPADVAAALPATVRAYQAAMRPAKRKDLMLILGRLLLHYHTPDRNEVQFRELFADYLEDLAEFPAFAVAEAARSWRRTERWWPKVAELRELCEAAVRSHQRRLHRLMFLALCSDRFGGECPRLEWLRAEAASGPPDWVIERALHGEWTSGIHRFVLPSPACQSGGPYDSATPSAA